MVGFGATKYFMASQKADRNSVSSIDLAAVARRLKVKLSTSGSMLPELQHRRYDDNHGERERQEYLPPESHQLVVAIARHHGLDHGEQEEQEAGLQGEPYHARYPGEGRHREERQPTAQEEDGAEPAHQNHGDVFAEHEKHIGGRRIFDHEACDELGFRS